VFCVRPGEADLRGFFGADPIEDCDLTPDGLSTPTLAALLIEEATRDRFVAYLASKRQQREAREARERQEREARLARERQERERRWLESDVRKAIPWEAARRSGTGWLHPIGTTVGVCESGGGTGATSAERA